jgi:hypothetical protein
MTRPSDATAALSIVVYIVAVGALLLLRACKRS